MKFFARSSLDILRDVWPETREQRCWVHRFANVLDKLPKRLHRQAKATLHEIMRAETWKAAERAIVCFEADYGAKYPNAVASLRRDEAELLALFDFPAEHWLHLRTGNVIESPFATVRLRQRVTKGAGSRRKGLLMAFRLLAMAERRWRRVNPPSRATRKGRGSVQRRRSSGRANCGLTWSRGRFRE